MPYTFKYTINRNQKGIGLMGEKSIPGLDPRHLHEKIAAPSIEITAPLH